MTSALPPERSEQVRTFFHQVADLAPEERAAHLDGLCGSDAELRRELEALLTAHDRAPDLLDRLDRQLPWALDSSREQNDPLLGRRVSHYQILEKLGDGGMGVVYRARDGTLDRMVALKFLPPHLSLDEEAKQRFVQEAKAASALDHPNICTIYEIGESAAGSTGRQLFIAMACYEGETLKRKIERGPLLLSDALDYAVQVAEALQRAHEAGIVHRDLKPANVLVTTRGQVKLLDFGIAKVHDEGMTRTGVTLGTVAYMSPEQAKGEAIDHRSDLWSLGVVLYEMLSGVRPFRGEHEQAVLHAIQHREPLPLERLSEEVSPELVHLVRRCLARQPAARYPSAEVLLEDLRSIQPTQRERGSRSPGAPVAESNRRRVFRVGGVYAAAGLVLLLAANRLFQALLLPEWSFSLLVVFVVLGFALTLALARAFELTPEGVRRTRPVHRPDTAAARPTDRAGRLTVSVFDPLAARSRLAQGWQVWGGAALVLLIVGAAGLLWRPGSERWGRQPALAGTEVVHSERFSLAVLPLKNFSGDPDQEYFADGMTEELITTLTKIEALRVIAHRSVLQFKQSDQAVPQIARLLGVRYVVDGSVLQDGDRVRVTANLIDAASNTPIWGESFARERRDILALQQEVALAIARQIEVTLGPDDRERLADVRQVDPEAFDLYVRGTQARYQLTPGFAQASAYFRRAISRDPDYAPAYAGLAWIAAYVGDEDEGRRLAERALRLDPGLAEPHVVLGLIRQFSEWDWRGAEEALRQAIRLNPGYAEAHHELSMLLMRQRRFDEAVREAQLTLYLAPMSARFQVGLGEVYLYAGRHGEAIVAIEKGMALDPSYQAQIWLALALGGQGRYDRALELAREAAAIAPAAWCSYGRAYGGYLNAAKGMRAQARQTLASLEQELTEESVETSACGYSLAMLHTGLEEYHRALELLEHHHAPDHLVWSYLAIEPAFRPLHPEPRFQALLKKMSLE